MSTTPLMIIDGYNVILNNTSIDDDDEESLRHAREELIRRLISRWGHKKIRIIVVFDGQPNTFSHIHRPASFNIIFSRAPQQADDIILQLIRKETVPKNIILVTSDRKLADDGISYGVRHWPVEKLISKIIPDTKTRHYSAKYDRPLTADEVEEWKKVFNLKEDNPS